MLFTNALLVIIIAILIVLGRRIITGFNEIITGLEMTLDLLLAIKKLKDNKK